MLATHARRRKPAAAPIETAVMLLAHTIIRFAHEDGLDD